MKEIDIALSLKQLNKLKDYCVLIPDTSNKVLLLAKYVYNKHQSDQYFEYNPINKKMVIDPSYANGRNRGFFRFINGLLSSDKQLQLFITKK
jgi:hypothetical protein